jgi:hypothetical protein
LRWHYTGVEDGVPEDDVPDDEYYYGTEPSVAQRLVDPLARAVRRWSLFEGVALVLVVAGVIRMIGAVLAGLALSGEGGGQAAQALGGEGGAPGVQILAYVCAAGDEVGVGLVAVLLGLLWWQVQLRRVEADEACEFDDWEERNQDAISHMLRLRRLANGAMILTLLTAACAAGRLVSQLMYQSPTWDKYLDVGYGLAYALVAGATVVVAVRLVQKCNLFFSGEEDTDEDGEDVDALEDLFTGFTRTHGEDHPYTLAAGAKLAEALLDDGRLDEGVQLYNAVIADQQRVLGVDHPDVVASQSALAIGLWAGGEINQATTMFDMVYATQLRILGPDDPGTVDTRSCLEDLRHNPDL